MNKFKKLLVVLVRVAIHYRCYISINRKSKRQTDEKPSHLRSHVLVLGLPQISHKGLYMGCNICK